MSVRAEREGLSSTEQRRFHETLAAMSADQGHVEHLLRMIIRAWCRIFAWRIFVTRHALPRGIDTVPGAGCVVAAAAHRTWLEPFLLLAAWPTDAARLVWLADGRTVTRSWWRRRLLPSLGVIPIAGRGGPRTYAELAAEVLAAGHALAIFPEVGPPSPSDQPRSISAGFAYLAIRAGAPIIPVVVGGTHRVVRGSSFSVDILTALNVGEALDDPFTPSGRARASELTVSYEAVVAELLPRRTGEADARAPERERWRWLGTLFR